MCPGYETYRAELMATSQHHERSATYSRKFNAALWFYDRNQLNECAESARDLLDDPGLPRYHRMKTLILLASITGWHDAEECRIEAEQFWRGARVQYSSPTFDEEEALTELRTQLDALKAAQDYELFAGPPGWVDDERDLDASHAESEDNEEDLDASPSDMEVEEAARAEGVEESRSALDMAMPVAQATATASDQELDTMTPAAGVLSPPPFSNVDVSQNIVGPSSSQLLLFANLLLQPYRPIHHTRTACTLYRG
ncbi:hypothetical protein LTR03_013044 [Friedmanniomyces endolithicus]|nr:hypothetical protein LTR03_013044 [Friedmanniomyces endolithicus]